MTDPRAGRKGKIWSREYQRETDIWIHLLVGAAGPRRSGQSRDAFYETLSAILLGLVKAGAAVRLYWREEKEGLRHMDVASAPPAAAGAGRVPVNFCPAAGAAPLCRTAGGIRRAGGGFPRPSGRGSFLCEGGGSGAAAAHCQRRCLRPGCALLRGGGVCMAALQPSGPRRPAPAELAKKAALSLLAYIWIEHG